MFKCFPEYKAKGPGFGVLESGVKGQSISRSPALKEQAIERANRGSPAFKTLVWEEDKQENRPSETAGVHLGQVKVPLPTVPARPNPQLPDPVLRGPPATPVRSNFNSKHPSLDPGRKA